jgi:hypothetical protein
LELKFTRHALVESMPDEKIGVDEVRAAVCGSELTVRMAERKFRFRRRGVEVVAQKEKGYWLVITCYRV